MVILKDKSIPSEYLRILFVTLVLSAGIILRFLGRRKGAFNLLYFFFLGAAFMLIETKSIVQLSLLFGATWVVNSVVISGILIMILIANLYVIKFKPKKIGFWYILLSASLLFSWFFDPQSIILQSELSKIFIHVSVLIIPLFFAAIIFASLFRETKNVPMAFGMNLLGIVSGGFLEYFSLIVGLNNLALIALIIYFFHIGAIEEPVAIRKIWLFNVTI